MAGVQRQRGDNYKTRRAVLVLVSVRGDHHAGRDGHRHQLLEQQFARVGQFHKGYLKGKNNKGVKSVIRMVTSLPSTVNCLEYYLKGQGAV